MVEAVTFIEPQPMKKTALMLEVEARFGEPIEDLLHRLYIEEDRSSIGVQKFLGLNNNVTVRRWIRSADIPIKGQRSTTLRNIWNERGQELIAKIHSGDSDLRRSESRRRLHRENVEALEMDRRNAALAREVALNINQARRALAFGTDEGLRLYEMHQILGLTAEEIAGLTEYSSGAIRTLLRRNNVDYVNKTDSRTVHSFQAVQQALWSNPSLFQKLTPQEKRIIERRFLSDGPIPILDEVSNDLGVTRQAISLWEQRALAKLLNLGHLKH